MTIKNLKIIIITIFIIFFSFNFIPSIIELCNDYNSENIEYKLKEEIKNNSLDDLENLGIEDVNNIDKETILVLKNRLLVIGIAFNFVIAFILAIFEPILLWVILIAIYFSKKKYIKIKLSSVDFSKDKNYFRDILREYSPSVLAYIDNFSLNYPTALLGDLLMLEERKFIKINKDNITLINNVGKESLTPTLRYVFNNIVNGKLNINRSEYENIVINEARSLDLLEDDEKEENILKRDLIISSIIYIVFLILIIIIFLNIEVFNYISNPFILIVILFVIFLLLIILTFYPMMKLISLLMLSIKLKKNNGIRTLKGEEVNLKLEGLKNFLNDFSLLNEKSKEELIIWQDYLIYSVIFNQNTKIVDKYKNVIE